MLILLNLRPSFLFAHYNVVPQYYSGLTKPHQKYKSEQLCTFSFLIYRIYEDVNLSLPLKCRFILMWLPKLVPHTAGTLVFCQTVQTDKKNANLVTLSLSRNN